MTDSTAHIKHLYANAHPDPKETHIMEWWRQEGDCGGLSWDELYTVHFLTRWNCTAREYVTVLKCYFWFSLNILSALFRWSPVFFNIYFIFMDILPVCEYMCAKYVPGAMEVRRRHRISWNRWLWADLWVMRLNTGCLQEQLVPLTADQSLQKQSILFK